MTPSDNTARIACSRAVVETVCQDHGMCSVAQPVTTLTLHIFKNQCTNWMAMDTISATRQVQSQSMYIFVFFYLCWASQGLTHWHKLLLKLSTLTTWLSASFHMTVTGTHRCQPLCVSLASLHRKIVVRYVNDTIDDDRSNSCCQLCALVTPDHFWDHLNHIGLAALALHIHA